LTHYCAVLVMQPDLRRAAGMVARRKLRAPARSIGWSSVQLDVSDYVQTHVCDGLYYKVSSSILEQQSEHGAYASVFSKFKFRLCVLPCLCTAMTGE